MRLLACGLRCDSFFRTATNHFPDSGLTLPNSALLARLLFVSDIYRGNRVENRLYILIPGTRCHAIQYRPGFPDIPSLQGKAKGGVVPCPILALNQDSRPYRA